ncbi:restriction endonuclease subunit S [Kitasatospora sp. NPDC056076]|uniref:restriction endonuclease subunit S n=1 Tax=Kitasatospora sp. NPDC056076 TaxID=3345703 RepID=UPI0035DEF9EE
MRDEALTARRVAFPAEWRRMRLADVGKWLSGGTPSTSNNAYWGGDIPWISAASLKAFRIAESARRVTMLGAENGSRLVEAGTLLFVVRGMSLKSEFRLGVTQRTVAFGQDCKAVIPAEGIDAHFLAHAIKAKTPEILAMVEETSHGTGRLDTSRLQGLEIGLPSLPEQRRIVAAHDAIEHRIAALEQVLAKSVVVEAALSASALASGAGEWPIQRLESVAVVAAGVTLGSEPTGDGVIELPYLRVANVLDGRIDTADVKTIRIMRSQLDRYALRRGDLLLTEGGDLDKLGRGAVWDGRLDPCLHQNHVFRVRCSNALSPDFLELYASSPAGRAYFQSVGKQTTNLASINSTQVKNMPVPIPSREEQDRLLAPVRAIRARIAILAKQIEKLKVVQKGMTEDLLAGRVRV